MPVTQGKWRQTVVLTRAEGEQMEQILQKYGVANVSQLCKMMLKGINISTDSMVDINIRYREILQEIKALVKEV